MTHKILVVEDNPITRKMVRIALEVEGFMVLEATDAATAIAIASHVRPALILQDMVLPDASGSDLLACLRALPDTATVPIIALTGLEARIVEARKSDFAFDEILTKPIEPSRLIACVRAHLSPTPGASALAHRRILLVDDDPVELKLAEMQLGLIGFQVETARNGSEALELARRHAPDAILSDVMMPQVDGFELCQHARADARLHDVPIVLMSAHYLDPADQQLAARAGANALVARSPSTEAAIKALVDCLDHHVTPSVTPVDLRDDHARAVQRQLDRQLERNRELTSERERNDTTNCVLGRLARILGRQTDLDHALEDAIYTVLDSTHANLGAVYLENALHTWRMAAQVGAASSDLSVTHRQLLQRCVTPGESLALATDGDGRDVLEMLGARDGVLFPLFAQNLRVGAMLIGLRAGELDSQTIELARMVAMHIGLAVALSGSNQRLVTSQRQYQMLLDASNDAVTVIAPDGTIVDANRKSLEVAGVTRDQLIGHHMYEFAADQQQTVMDELLAGEPGRTSLILRRPDGEVRHLETTRVPLEIDGQVLAFMIARDVTKKVEVVAKLRASEAKYRSLAESIPDIVWCGTLARTYEVSANVEAITGFTATELQIEAIDTWFGRVHLDDVARVREAFEAFIAFGATLDLEYRFQCKDRAWAWLHARGVRTYEADGVRQACVLVTDVTQRRRLEEQMRMAQKMEAIGRLSGGIAHDFNNILAVILSNCDFVDETLAERDPRRTDVLEIRRAGERGASLTRQLLAFSRRQVIEPTIVDLNEVVRDLQKMLRRLIGEDVTLTVKPGDSLQLVRADAGQIEQVIMNLVVNARDAMPRGGQLTIETCNVELDDEFAAAHVPTIPGSYVQISVTDTGCGMDAATQRRIFEPFFTTKHDKGTGLGLSTTYGIVKQSGGFIWVYSEIDRGSSFKVYLPCVAARRSTTRTKLEPVTERRGTETILLLEDDDGVRTGVTRMLTGRGYRVLPARDAGEALQIAMAEASAIDMVLSDVVLPGGNGLEIVNALKAHTMSMKALFMSGYTEHAVFVNGELPEGVAFIHKPFSAQALVKKVREVIDADTASDRESNAAHELHAVVDSAQ